MIHHVTAVELALLPCPPDAVNLLEALKTLKWFWSKHCSDWQFGEGLLLQVIFRTHQKEQMRTEEKQITIKGWLSQLVQNGEENVESFHHYHTSNLVCNSFPHGWVHNLLHERWRLCTMGFYLFIFLITILLLKAIAKKLRVAPLPPLCHCYTQVICLDFFLTLINASKQSSTKCCTNGNKILHSCLASYL